MNTISIWGNWFSVRGNWFSVRGNWFSVGWNWFSVGGNWFSIGGNWFSVGGNWFSVGRNWFSVRGNRPVNGIEFILLKLLGRNYLQISFKFSFKNNFAIKSFLIIKTAFLPSCAPASFINLNANLAKITISGVQWSSQKFVFLSTSAFRPAPIVPLPHLIPHPWQHCEEKITPSNYSIFL